MSQDNADQATALPEPDAGTETETANVEEAYYISAGTVVSEGPSIWAKLGAEAFGTFLLVIAGLGVALYMNVSGIGTALAVGLAFGLAVVAGAIAVGHISGGHFNPAVTLGAAIAGRTSWKHLLPYWLAQLVGGIAAAAVLFITIPQKLPGLITAGDSVNTFFSHTANGYGEHSPLALATQNQVSFSLAQALLIEIVVTALFVGVILGATDRRSNIASAPLAIGLVLSVLILVALPITNASLNPARSTAAALFSATWAREQLWLFWLAPLVGAALAALVYRAFAAEPVEDNLLEEDDEYLVTEDTVVITES